MLHEISSCLSGAWKISFKRFLTAWIIETIPYLCVITYVGSISNLENPIPTIYAALGIIFLFWFIWMIFMRIDKRRTLRENQ